VNGHLESVNDLFIARRGVAGASHHRSDIRSYKELALRNRVLWDGAGRRSYGFTVWCVAPLPF
jgi:hypothetical protein